MAKPKKEKYVTQKEFRDAIYWLYWQLRPSAPRNDEYEQEVYDSCMKGEWE